MSEEKKSECNDKCACGCGCDADCNCGCRDGGKCSCNDKCACGCGCHNYHPFLREIARTIALSAVASVTAILISRVLNKLLK